MRSSYLDCTNFSYAIKLNRLELALLNKSIVVRL
nr:MAG TPA: hypothetical protein [Crassvirales sp.]